MTRDSATHVLAFDLGTSGPKTALVSPSGSVADWEFEPTPVALQPGGGAEQAPGDWWRAVTAATRRMMARGAVPPDRVAALSVTTQWSGTVAVDRHGDPLTNAIIWMDSRGAEDVRRLVGGGPRIAGYGAGKLIPWVRLTGGVPTLSGKDPIAHILFLKRTRPDVFRNAHKFLEPKDFLNLRLTGLFAASWDSIALHWVTDNRDIGRIRYSERLLRMAGISREQLPDLRRAVDILGPLRPAPAKELGLPPGIPVITGTPDIHSAAVGSGAVENYRAHLYLGTSSWLTCHVPFKKTDLLHNMASLPSALPGKYFVANEQETAGGCLSFLLDLLADPETAGRKRPHHSEAYAGLERIAGRAPAGSGGVIFTPWLYGERTPVEEHTLRGGFHNLSLETRREHLVRAVFEGVAYNGRWLLRYVERFVRRRFDTIHMVGGGSRSDLWCRIHADVLGRRIHQVRDPLLANARGAGLLGAVGLGLLRVEDIPSRVEIAASYEPDPNRRRTYDRMFREYINLYRGTRSVYARMNRTGRRI